MCRCCSKFFTGIMSCITLGLCFGVALALLLMILDHQVPSVTDDLELALIITCSVTGILFLFSLYASCCGKSCARKTLGTIYVILALGLVGVSIFGWLYGSEIVPLIGNCWYIGESYNKDVIDSFERSFECCGFNTSFLCPLKSERCEPKITSAFNLLINIGGIVFCVVAFLLFICVSLLCCRCCNKPSSDAIDILP